MIGTTSRSGHDTLRAKMREESTLRLCRDGSYGLLSGGRDGTVCVENSSRKPDRRERAIRLDFHESNGLGYDNSPERETPRAVFHV